MKFPLWEWILRKVGSSYVSKINRTPYGDKRDFIEEIQHKCQAAEEGTLDKEDQVKTREAESSSYCRNSHVFLIDTLLFLL